MKHPPHILCSLAVLLVAAFGAALMLGASFRTPAAVWQGLLEKQFDMWDYRLPRAILAVVIGAALALSGAMIQGIIHNPLASPDILSVNHGAGLAAVLLLTFVPGASVWMLPLAASGGAAVAFLILLLISRPKSGPLQMALLGVALSAFYAAVTDYLMLTQTPEINTAVLWLTGSLWGRSWAFVQVAVPLVFCLMPIALCHCKTFDLLTLGDDKAATLGVKLHLTRPLLLANAVLLAAVAVAVAGPIAFLGLVAPHLARKLVGGRHCYLLPAAMLCGACILLASDIAVRSIDPPLELPAGIFTALIGAPYFFYLLKRSG